jgi:hypothetical protein
VGSRIGMDDLERRKFLPLPGMEPRAVQPVAIPTHKDSILHPIIGLLRFFGSPFRPAQGSGPCDRRWTGLSGMPSELWLPLMGSSVLAMFVGGAGIRVCV